MTLLRVPFKRADCADRTFGSTAGEPSLFNKYSKQSKHQPGNQLLLIRPYLAVQPSRAALILDPTLVAQP